MENLLATWLEDCNQKRIPIRTNNMTVQAFSLFSSLKKTTSKRIPRYFLPAEGGLKSL
jgi:hypothetical protein